MNMVNAKLEEVDGSGSLQFQFNPSEYTVKKTAQWDTPRRSMNTQAGAKPDYVGTNPQTVSLQIFFDGWEESRDITGDVDKLFTWCTPSRSTVSKKTPHPSLLRFIWGSNAQLANHKFYLESVTAKYTMFKPDGTPVRATADIGLKEVPDEPAGTNPTSGSIEARGTHLIADGDTLQSISYKEYGNPNLWRGLAAFNHIDDPLRLSKGNRILLPSADEAAQGSKRG